MATISKRGKHQWQAKIRRKGYPVQSNTFERKIDADQWARDNENKMNRGLIELAAQSHAAQWSSKGAPLLTYQVCIAAKYSVSN